MAVNGLNRRPVNQMHVQGGMQALQSTTDTAFFDAKQM